MLGKKKITIPDKLYKYIAFALTFIYMCSYVFTEHSIYFYSDQLGTLASAAKLAGNDWSSMMASTPYYGFGYYWIMFIIMKMTNDYHIIYLGILTIDLILCSLTSFLIYFIISKKIIKKDGIVAVLLTVAASSMHVYWVGIFNERPAYIIVWIITYLLIKVFETNEMPKKNWIYVFILTFFLGYATIVHERLIALWIAVIIVAVFGKLFLKRNFIRLSPLIFGSVINYAIFREIKNIVVEVLWNIRSENLENTSVINTDVISSYINVIKGVLVCVFTNLYKFVMSSYGLGFFAIIFLLIGIKNVLLKRKSIDSVADSVLFIHCIFMTAILITIFGLGYNQGDYIITGFENSIDSQSYKALFYLRYYSIYMGPVIPTTWMMMKKIDVKKYIMWGGYGIIFSIGLIIKVILPKIMGTSFFGATFDFMPVYFTINGKNVAETFVKSVVVSFLVFGFMYFLLCLNKKCTNVLYLGLITVYLLLNVKNISIPDVYSETHEAAYEFISSVEKKVDLPSVIYCDADPRTCQFVLNDYTIIPSMPTADENMAIYLSDHFVEGMYGYYSMQLDENEYIYIKGIDESELLSNY